MALLFTSLLDPGGGFPGADPDEPRFTVYGEEGASGDGGSTRNFQVTTILGQRYLPGIAGQIVGLRAWFGGTGTPSFRMSVYTDGSNLPGNLLAVVEGTAPGVQGWHEFALDPADYVTIGASTAIWVAAQTSANINSASGVGLVAANTHRRLRSFSFASGAPDPFASTGGYNNTRALGLRIWTNPP